VSEKQLAMQIHCKKDHFYMFFGTEKIWIGRWGIVDWKNSDRNGGDIRNIFSIGSSISELGNAIETGWRSVDEASIRL